MKKLPLVPKGDREAQNESVQVHKTLSERFKRARWILLAVLIVFSSVMLLFGSQSINYENFLFLLRDLDAEYHADADATGIGVSYDADTDMSARVFKKHLIVTDTESVHLYGLSGYKVFSYPHSYENPCIAVSDQYFAVYDAGGHTFSVYNTLGLLYESKAYDQPIVDMDISSNGICAIVTKTKANRSSVCVLDRDFEMIAAYNTTRYITKARLSSDGDTLITSSIYTNNGVPITVVQAYEVGDDEEHFKIEYPRTSSAINTGSSALPLDVGVIGSSIATVCNTGVLFCDDDGDSDYFYAYLDNLPNEAGDLFAASYGEGRIALLFRDRAQDSRCHLRVLDGDGDPIHDENETIVIDDYISALAYHNQTLFLLSPNYVYRLSKGGTLKQTKLTSSGDVLTFAAFDDQTAVISYRDRTVSVSFD